MSRFFPDSNSEESTTIKVLVMESLRAPTNEEIEAFRDFMRQQDNSFLCPEHNPTGNMTDSKREDHQRRAHHQPWVEVYEITLDRSRVFSSEGFDYAEVISEVKNRKPLYSDQAYGWHLDASLISDGALVIVGSAAYRAKIEEIQHANDEDNDEPNPTPSNPNFG